MERYTRTVDGKVTVAPEEMAAALERLSAFEDMACGVERASEKEALFPYDEKSVKDFF